MDGTAHSKSFTWRRTLRSKRCCTSSSISFRCLCSTWNGMECTGTALSWSLIECVSAGINPRHISISLLNFLIRAGQMQSYTGRKLCIFASCWKYVKSYVTSCFCRFNFGYIEEMCNSQMTNMLYCTWFCPSTLLKLQSRVWSKLEGHGWFLVQWCNMSCFALMCYPTWSCLLECGVVSIQPIHNKSRPLLWWWRIHD